MLEITLRMKPSLQLVPMYLHPEPVFLNAVYYRSGNPAQIYLNESLKSEITPWKQDMKIELAP